MFNIRVTGQNPADAKAKTAAAIAALPTPGPIEAQLLPSVQNHVNVCCDAMTAAGYNKPVDIRARSQVIDNGVNLSVDVDAWDFINA